MPSIFFYLYIVIIAHEYIQSEARRFKRQFRVISGSTKREPITPSHCNQKGTGHLTRLIHLILTFPVASLGGGMSLAKAILVFPAHAMLRQLSDKRFRSQLREESPSMSLILGQDKGLA